MRIPGTLLCALLSLQGHAENQPGGSTPFRSEILKKIDTVISNAIQKKKLPGGVLWLERNNEIYQKAYGRRATVPAHEAMSLDTIFDAASLTKVIATTPCILKLIEDSRISLDDRHPGFYRSSPGIRTSPASRSVTFSPIPAASSRAFAAATTGGDGPPESLLPAASPRPGTPVTTTATATSISFFSEKSSVGFRENPSQSSHRKQFLSPCK